MLRSREVIAMKQLDCFKLVFQISLIVIGALVAPMTINTMTCAAVPTGVELSRDNSEFTNRDKSGTSACVKKQRAPQTTVNKRFAEHVTIEAEREGFSAGSFAARTPRVVWSL